MRIESDEFKVRTPLTPNFRRCPRKMRIESEGTSTLRLEPLPHFRRCPRKMRIERSSIKLTSHPVVPFQKVSSQNED